MYFLAEHSIKFMDAGSKRQKNKLIKEHKMSKLISLINGKKTFIIAGLVGIGAVLTMLGFHIPDFVWPILGALGLGAVRDAISKLEK